MVYGVLDHSNSLLKDKQYKQKTSLESYKIEIKIFVNPLAQSTLNNPDLRPRGQTFETIRQNSGGKGRGVGGGEREGGREGSYHAGCSIIRKRLGLSFTNLKKND